MKMQRNPSLLNKQIFDVLIIGGGIYGAWSAYLATCAGLSVAVVEKNDWAGATSSASSKLIHGGLRYLEFFDFPLVRKTVKEREHLLGIAPHRILPLKFFTPVYPDSRFSFMKLKTGLFLYDVLAGSNRVSSKHQCFTNKMAVQNFEAVSQFLSKGQSFSRLCTFYDAITDDARLTLEIIDGALDDGAIACNYIEVENIQHTEDGKVKAQVKDLTSGIELSVYSQCVIMATGPWLEKLLPEMNNNIHHRLVKGIHLVMPAINELNNTQNDAFLFTARKDNRVYFLIPWYGCSLLGTTEADCQENPDDLDISRTEIEYLLDEINYRLPQLNWKYSDVQGVFAGIRTLCDDTKTAANQSSRDWGLNQLEDNIFVSVGGKLTSARAETVTIVKKVLAYLNRSEHNSDMESSRFPWSPSGDYELWYQTTLESGLRLNIRSDIITYLIQRYGCHVANIFSLIEQNSRLKQPIIEHLPFCYAELHYVSHNEMVVHLDDLLRRRIPLLILHRFNEFSFCQLATYCAQLLSWNEHYLKAEILRVKEHVYTRHWS